MGSTVTTLKLLSSSVKESTLHVGLVWRSVAKLLVESHIVGCTFQCDFIAIQFFAEERKGWNQPTGQKREGGREGRGVEKKISKNDKIFSVEQSSAQRNICFRLQAGLLTVSPAASLCRRHWRRLPPPGLSANKTEERHTFSPVHIMLSLATIYRILHQTHQLVHLYISSGNSKVSRYQMCLNSRDTCTKRCTSTSRIFPLDPHGALRKHRDMEWKDSLDMSLENARTSTIYKWYHRTVWMYFM